MCTEARSRARARARQSDLIAERRYGTAVDYDDGASAEARAGASKGRHGPTQMINDRKTYEARREAGRAATEAAKERRGDTEGAHSAQAAMTT